MSAWKLIPMVLMLGALVVGFAARPPRDPVPAAELRRLIVAIGALYVVGAVALVVHRTALACVVFGAGLLICALSLWLSRGDPPPHEDSDEDESGGGGGGTRPILPTPSGPSFDWAFYEDQFNESSPDPAPAAH